jgi:hypothetical protein
MGNKLVFLIILYYKIQFYFLFRTVSIGNFKYNFIKIKIGI